MTIVAQCANRVMVLPPMPSGLRDEAERRSFSVPTCGVCIAYYVGAVTRVGECRLSVEYHIGWR